MPTKPYDYAIIGAGAAGLQLALKMSNDPFFEKKRILIIEKEKKNTNDRTWSFWEMGESHWDRLATKVWDKGLFVNKNEVELSFNPYRYKTIRSADLYDYARSILNKKNGFHWVQEEVIEVDNKTIRTTKGSYQTTHTFDSRIAPAFQQTMGQYDALIQHFKGWIIETETDFFDTKVFTMMDYRLQWKDHTSFTYILPFSPTQALVEFTLFDHHILTDEEYDYMLGKYMTDYLKLESYKIVETEKGQIPMTTYPFHKDHQPHLTKIGTAGGWVRPSSGYSFKNADRYTTKIVDNLKKQKKPHNGLINQKHWYYDLVFLHVLANANQIGSEIFSIFYTKHPLPRLLRFLDGKSTLMEDIKIIYSLHRKEFRRALLSILKFR